ncbi:MAG: ISKra4 family transposase [Pseudomonadota bacterium]
MEETIESFEKKREHLYRDLREVGDFRRGIISVIYRKCGKKYCACAKEGHPGHGPLHLWNTTIKGKSYAKSVKLGPEMQKYLDEIGNHRRFVELCAEIVVVNERICDLRPVREVKDEKEMDELKKKFAETVHGEVQKEIERIVGRYYFEKDNGNSFDLESFELAIRSSMHGVGRSMLEMFVNADGGDYRGRTIPCEKDHQHEFIEFRDKKLLTVLGSVTVKRAYYYDRECRSGHCPKDRALDIEGTSYSSGVRRMMSKVGAYRPFGLGQEDLYELADIRVNAKEVERISQMVGGQAQAFHAAEAEASLSDNIIPIKPVPKMYVCIDGTGVPVVKKETAGRKGKGEDGQAKTREVKLGCVFTQTRVDREGRPVRDDESTSYTGAIETAELFGRRIYQEAMRRGMDWAGETVVIGDGAPWIWNIADEQFYGATQIVDLFHAREHYWNVAKACFGQNKDNLYQWAEERRKELDDGRPEEVIDAINRCSSLPGYDKAICEREIGYFEKNKERMRYADFRKRGLFVGSGVLEAGCRTVVGQRLKQSGMHWTVRGANSIIALRCSILSNRWEDFWEHRATA